MFDPANPLPYIVGILVIVLAYFLKDAHMHIKIKLEKTATAKELEEAKEQWRLDFLEIQRRHQLETTRLEAQYEQKFQGAVVQFQNQVTGVQNQIMGVERNLTDRMDMILRIIERRNT